MRVVCDNLCLGYDRGPVLEGVSGTIDAGDLLAIVGPNGGGKSTLLKGLAGLLRPLSGTIRHEGLHRAEMAYLPQQAELDRAFPISVLELVSAGAWRSMGVWRGFGGGKRVAALRALASVGLEGLEHCSIGHLSGGQLQRALFARLILQDARLLLLDEPFAAVDEATTNDLLALMALWHREGRTVVAVLHDIDTVRAHFPKSLLLAREVMGWGNTAQVLDAATLMQARRLINADTGFAPRRPAA